MKVYSVVKVPLFPDVLMADTYALIREQKKEKENHKVGLRLALLFQI